MTNELEIATTDDTLVASVARGDQNLFTGDMIDTLSDAIASAAGDGLRFVHLRAKGPVFCVGRERSGRTALELRAEAARIVGLNEAIRTTPLTVIAEVNGDAAGFGAGLVAAADVAIAADHARFSFPEILGGLAPAIVISWLAKAVPHKVAFHLVTTGEQIDALYAQRLGLVTDVVPAEHLEQAVDERIKRLAEMSAGAIKEIKEFFTRARSLDPPHSAASSVEALALSAVRLRSEKEVAGA